MTPVLVDSNVLLDVATADPRELGQRNPSESPTGLSSSSTRWSRRGLRRLRRSGRRDRPCPSICIGARISVRAAFLAKCFVQYRGERGKRSPLPTYIGAHAAVAGYRLLTRDATRYRSYFPRLELIAP
jgi:predicted nucleic acid-binding protein